MKKPLFSIVIPTYNRANVIERCISSVINQTFKEWEIILIDNYSDDNTERIVNDFNDDRIHYFKNNNYGVISVSRNFGLDHAIGEWICFLDSDDSWMENKLEQLLPYVKDYDLIYHGYISNRKRIRPFQKNGNMFYTIKVPTMQYIIQRGDPINPSCTAVRRRFIGNTRMSEDKSFFAIEDYDFFLQLMEKNPRVLHLKKFLTYYDVTTGVSHDNIKHRDRSRLVFMKYKPKLTRNEFRNVLKLYMGMRGDEYYENDPKKAREYYRIMSSSTAFDISIKGKELVMKTYILQFRNYVRKIMKKSNDGFSSIN